MIPKHADSTVPWRIYAAEMMRSEQTLSFSVIVPAITKQALMHNLILSTDDIDGAASTWMEEEKAATDAQPSPGIQKVIAFADHLVKDLGGHPIRTEEHERFICWDRVAVRIGYATHGFRLTCMSTETELMQQILTKAKALVVEQPPKRPLPTRVQRGSIHVLLPTRNGGFHFQNIGPEPCKLSPDNYADDVLRQFAHVVEDMRSKNPSGRLTLLEGPTGTGKTYLVRALLNDLPTAKFLVLPPSAMANLGDPSLLKALLDADEEVIVEDEEPEEAEEEVAPKYVRQKRTLVLILEDADTALTQRTSENISAVANLLNLSDGLIGSLLDLRIVCTTNAKADDVDPALVRDGRISERIRIGNLPVDKAYQLYKKLGGTEGERWKEGRHRGELSLAQVYGAVHKERELREKEEALTTPAAPQDQVA